MRRELVMVIALISHFMSIVFLFTSPLAKAIGAILWFIMFRLLILTIKDNKRKKIKAN